MADIHTTAPIYAEGDIHANNIVQSIKIKTPDPPAKNVRFKVEKPIQTFIGRETFLEELHKVVKEGQYGGGGGVTVLTHDLSVVAATGGIGKTETVRRYIQLHEHEYDHIIWIDAEDVSFARNQFYQLAMRLKISTDFDGKQKDFDLILTEIFEKLLLNAHVVLLVFDNAEALEDDEELSLNGIRSLRPTSLSPFFVEPTIIVTSRNQNWSLQKVIHLDLWTEAEVVIFVFGRLGLENNSENESLALQLGTLFGRLPIALQAAVAVILQQIKRRKNYGIQSLIDEYESGSRKVLAQKPLEANMRPKQTSIPMLVLWNISLEKIVRYEDGKLAIKILCFMAYMSPTRIPQDFLFAHFKNSCTEDSFENALEILEDYSLIASLGSADDSDSRSFSIHRMIQDSTIENLRTRTNEGQTPHVIFNETTFLNEAEVLLKLSAESVDYLGAFEADTLPLREELVETLLQITYHVSDKLDEEVFRDLTKGTAEFLQKSNNFPKSIELLERAYNATASRDGIEISKKIELQRALAHAYFEGGHFRESLDLYLIVLEVQTQELGPHHDRTLCTKGKVADALHIVGRYNEADKMMQDVIQGYKNNRGTQRITFPEPKVNYAALFFRNEENKVASERWTEVLKEEEMDPDSNSQSIISTKFQIASALRREGHTEEATKMELQNIEDATNLLGPFHLTTDSCRRAYAEGLCHEKKYDLATPLLEELLKIEETQFGPHHHYTLGTKDILVEVYIATKELEKAAALLDIQGMEKAFGLESLVTRRAIEVLCIVKEEQGKFGDALELCQQLLKVYKNVLRPNHNATVTTMHQIAILHFKMEEYEKAAEVAQELLELEEETIGKDNPKTIATLEFLTQCMEWLVYQNNLIMNFRAYTSVDVETGKIFLKSSDWDLQAAVDTYRNSNPNPSRTLTDAQIENNLIRIFMAMTGVDAETGKSSLQASDWLLMVALEGFFESRLNENIANLDLQDNAMIPSEAATDAEIQNVGDASCNETKVYTIQYTVVPVESALDSNKPTKSILFCLAGETRFRGQFGVSSTVKDLYKYVNEKHPHLGDCKYVLTLYPNIQLTKKEQTLEEAKIPKNVALIVKMLREQNK